MSFAAFGVSKELAQKQAKKRLKTIETAGADAAKATIAKWKFDRKLSKLDIAIKIFSNIGEIPHEAYQNAFDELTSYYMSHLTPKQISPVYGDPKICQEFIELAKRSGARNMALKQVVRIEHPKKANVFQSKWNDVPATLMH